MSSNTMLVKMLKFTCLYLIRADSLHKAQTLHFPSVCFPNHFRTHPSRCLPSEEKTSTVEESQKSGTTLKCTKISKNYTTFCNTTVLSLILLKLNKLIFKLPMEFPSF